ncbi:MAG TPA: hypothetical protein PLJ84_10070 [Bacteroidales bacterium]|nr:hypothetical protein [Bacteroidales bacterium]HPT02931.1 hypothetical protein [Bacteroidales bacterium]HPT02933.1 hypothetical protein [Bacteroidales bacterium]
MNKIIPIILAVILITATLPAISQNSPAHFIKGWGTELNFNPFDGSLSLNNATGQIKVRRFLNNDIALRAGITISAKNNTDKTKQAYGTSPYDASVKSKSNLVALSLGAEKHFNSGHRLSPYLGFEIGTGLKKTEQDFEYNHVTRTIKGAWMTEDVTYNGQYYVINDTYVERGFMSANANLFTGFDFYMADCFYFGYELGFGFEYTKYSKIEITQDPEYPYSGLYPDFDSKSWSLGPRLLNGIRIGYNF